MDRKIRCAVVGLGRAGWSLHVEQISKRLDMKVVAVVDRLSTRRAEAEMTLGCRSYASLGRMLKHQDDVELVVVATPSQRHAPDAKQALNAGRHVVVEKPMGLTTAQADSMIRTANRTDRRLFVHQNRRFDRIFTHMEEVLGSGLIGQLFHIRCYSANFARRNDWQTLSKYGGGVLNNTCPHYLDMILQLLGSNVVQIMGDLQQIASAGDVEDHVKVFMKCESGCTADLEVSSCQNIAFDIPIWMFCGTCGTLTSDGKTSTIRYFDPDEIEPLEVIDGAAPRRSYGNDDELPWQEKIVPSVGPDVGTFYDNIVAVLDRGEPMRVTPQSVRDVIRIIETVHKKSRFPGR